MFYSKFKIENKYKRKQTRSAGFTMVETLVAIAILMISIAGPLTIAQKGLTAAIYARDQVIASFLAQDAMEYIKNVRDNNVNYIINGDSRDWLDGIYNGTTNFCTDDLNNKCRINTTPGISFPINRVTSDYYLYKDSSGLYTTDSSGTKTMFTRYFYLTNVITNKEATVIVKVEWQNGTITNAVTLEDQIYFVQL